MSSRAILKSFLFAWRSIYGRKRGMFKLQEEGFNLPVCLSTCVVPDRSLGLEEHSWIGCISSSNARS